MCSSLSLIGSFFFFEDILYSQTPCNYTTDHQGLWTTRYKQKSMFYSCSAGQISILSNSGLNKETWTLKKRDQLYLSQCCEVQFIVFIIKIGGWLNRRNDFPLCPPFYKLASGQVSLIILGKETFNWTAGFGTVFLLLSRHRFKI